MKKKLESKKGFTLAELLIVVAIIAVLVAISIPVFTTQLEKSREATDLANARSAYAEVMVTALTGEASSTNVTVTDTSITATVELKQQVDNWQTIKSGETLDVGGIKSSDSTHWTGVPGKGGSVVITYNPTSGLCSLAWSGATGG